MKRTYNWGSIIFALFLGGLVLSMIVAATGYRPKARTIPLLAGSFTLLMIVITIFSELSPTIKSKLNIGLIDLDKFKKEGKSSPKASLGEVWTKILTALGWTVGTLIAIYLLGFHIALMAFSILFLRFHGEVGWIKSLILTAVLYGSVYLFFDVMLGVELYEGILFGALPPTFL